MPPNREWYYFQQEECLPQGCPFSAIIDVLVINIIIAKLDVKMRARAAKRKHDNILVYDKKGRINNLLALVGYLNDSVPIKD